MVDTLLAIPFEEVLKEYENLIAELEIPLREAQRKRAAVAALRDETQALRAGLHSAHEDARELGLLSHQPPPADRADSHLWVVPNEEEAAGSGHDPEDSESQGTRESTGTSDDAPGGKAAEPMAAAPSAAKGAPSGEASAEVPPNEVIVRGPA